MAIPIQTAALLVREANRRPFRGAIMQLGRQSLFFARPLFADFCRRHRLPVVASDRPLNDEVFFQTLGFDKIESLDADAKEQATHRLDLNQPLADTFAGRYDCVFDGGTIEHVFDVARALANVCAALKVGGRAIHMAVSSNYIDHGFYMFSPTLFSDFYIQNGFTIDQLLLVELCVVGAMEFLYPWKVFAYQPGCLDVYNRGAFGFSSLPVAIFCVATKNRETPTIVFPQQSMYARAADPNQPPPSTYRGLGAVGRFIATRMPLIVRAKRMWSRPRPAVIGSIDHHGQFHEP